MKHLLALLHGEASPGTHGTRPEPDRCEEQAASFFSAKQGVVEPGPLGTRGTPDGTLSRLSRAEVTIHVCALADAFAERMAICTENGTPEADARLLAQAEAGAEFVRRFALLD